MRLEQRGYVDEPQMEKNRKLASKDDVGTRKRQREEEERSILGHADVWIVRVVLYMEMTLKERRS